MREQLQRQGLGGVRQVHFAALNVRGSTYSNSLGSRHDRKGLQKTHLSSLQMVAGSGGGGLWFHGGRVITGSKLCSKVLVYLSIFCIVIIL